MVDYAMMSRNVRAFMSLFALQQAGGLQGARILRRRRYRHGAVLGPAGDRRRREDRVPARPACGARRRPRCGPTGSAPSAPSGCCSPATRCRAPRRSSGGWRSRRRGPERLDERTEALVGRIARMPLNQLQMMKLLVNQSLYSQGLHATQLLGTLFDGIARHTGRAMRSHGPGRARGLPGGGPRPRRAIRRPRAVDLQGMTEEVLVTHPRAAAAFGPGADRGGRLRRPRR